MKPSTSKAKGKAERQPVGLCRYSAMLICPLVVLFGQYAYDKKIKKIITDPYYGGVNGFEKSYQQIVHFTRGFLKQELGADLNS